MLSQPLRIAVVILFIFLIALVTLRPFLGDAIRAFPLAIVALLGALAVHALYRTRYR
jgi:hypothetical protein